MKCFVIGCLVAAAACWSASAGAALMGPNQQRCLQQEIKYVSGKDCVWFTADDAVYSYARYALDESGRILKKTEFVPGRDRVGFTADDEIVDYQVYAYAQERLVRTVTYSSRGPDKRWFTRDDRAGFHTDFEYDSQGRQIRSTKDLRRNAPASYINYEYDAAGFLVRDIEYGSAGADEEWFTADDEIAKYHTFSYAQAGRSLRITEYEGRHGGRGVDGRWFTQDDMVYQAKECEFDSNGHRVREIKHLENGPDQTWFTGDDELQYYTVFSYIHGDKC